jgi:hypothetical protein
MPRSTGKFISYDIRPAKQSERRILIEILKAAGDSGLPISKYRYVGMGANRFYDFLLIHRYLGINRMISLEHDENFVTRAKFNLPYKFIDVMNRSAADFVADDTSVDPSIYWLDYDGGLGPQMIGDINAYSNRCKVGDFFFVTVFGGPPRVIERVSDADRLAWLQDNLGDVAGKVGIEDVERSTFPTAVHKILMAAFTHAFAARTDGKFCPLLQVEYSDSMPMVSVGGGFLSDGQAVPVRSKMQNSLPFLETVSEKLYEVKSLHITEKERGLLDIAVTSSPRSAEMNLAKKIGFRDGELKAYRELIRFLPRYVETIV